MQAIFKNMTEHEYISIEEKEHFLSQLHRFLAWIGEKPGEVKINGEVINLNDIIWNCLHKELLSEDEKEKLLELIKKLQKEEENSENILLQEKISIEDAKRLYHECASLIRAIMDLKECESGKVKFIEHKEKDIKIEDAKRWINFLKGVGKKIDVN